MSNMSRNHKDNVFCLLYREKKYLLSLYNAVNGTSYEKEEELEVVTLENAICMKVRNDAAFVIDSTLNLYEHQSSASPNMPLRDLYYVAEELKKIAPSDTLYHRKKVKIPAPRFVVFYNGTEEQPEREVLRLSDLFEQPEEEPELELKVTVININPGYSEGLKGKCESLKGYMLFVQKTRDKKEAGMKIEEAVRQAVDECVAEGVLADFFTEHRKEVIEMSIFEFNQELYDQALRDDARADGIEEGIEQGIRQGMEQGELRKLISLVCKKIRKNQSLEEIAENLEEEVSTIRPIYDATRAAAPEDDIDEILRKIYVKM